MDGIRLSAYLLCHIGIELMNIVYGYSNEILMPFAETDERVIKKLFCENSEEYGKDVSHIKFWLSKPINQNDYVRWTKQIRHL